MTTMFPASPNQTDPTYGAIHCAIYARYSSDNQRTASIDDQIRNCRVLAQSKGWTILDDHIYTDEDRTGRTQVGRDGFQSLMVAAKPLNFQYILTDDVSRLGRDKADLFKTIDILSFRQVYVYFIEEGLDSKQSWFEESFHARAQQAAQQSKSMGHKIRRGREGRFLAGYNPGGGCYGYIDTPDQDFTRKGLYGRPAVKGVIQSIDPEQSAIVLRIFLMFASGMSLRTIAKVLNSEGIPTSQRARTRDKPSWCKSAIKAILRNPRYIGQATWNQSTQLLNPETGKYERRDNPEREWLRMDMPLLRIISDELWQEVKDQFVKTTRGFGVKRMGGMSRTERSRRYLFSGLLRCGFCGGRMIITTTSPSAYGCADHRSRNSCPNALTIRVDLLEQHFMAALTRQLEGNDLAEEVVASLLNHLNSSRSKTLQNESNGHSEKRTLEESLRQLRSEEDNLVRAIREVGHSRALLVGLTDLEERIVRVETLLQEATRPTQPEVSEEEIRTFLTNRKQSFLDLLLGSPETVRQELQKRIKMITMTPQVGKRKAYYRATGDVGLFSGGETVVQGNQVPSIALHYNIPITMDIVPRYGERRLPKAA